MGTTYHELLQAAIQRRYPTAEIEVKGIVHEANNSGHCDALVTVNGTRLLYELKTKTSYQFDKAVGMMRKAWKRGEPKGPALEVIMQAGFNARAHDCDTVVVGYVCWESYSVGLAAKVGLKNQDRFLAEWHIPKSVWEPLVERETDRLMEILDTVDGGFLPEREVYDEGPWYAEQLAETVVIGPEGTHPWNCDYCSHANQCLADGPGMVEIPVELRKKGEH